PEAGGGSEIRGDQQQEHPREGRVRRHREVWRRGQSQLGQRCPAEEQQETETTLTETSRTTVRCQAASTCRRNRRERSPWSGWRRPGAPSPRRWMQRSTSWVSTKTT